MALDDKRNEDIEKNERDIFLAAIRENPCAWDVRAIYADWLSDHGYDDEAAEQYRYGQPEVREAVETLVRMAANAGEHCESGYGAGVNYAAYSEARNAWIAAGRQGVEPSYDDEEFKTATPEVWRAVTYWDLIDAGTRYVNSGGNDWFTQVGDEGLRNNIRGELLEAYWKFWETITGRSRIHPNEYGDRSPFSCSC